MSDVNSRRPGSGLASKTNPTFLVQSDHWDLLMIEGDFNSRTLANVNVALDRVCGTPLGEQHDVRKRVAERILRCAKGGKTTLVALTEAGEQAVGPHPGRDLEVGLEEAIRAPRLSPMRPERRLTNQFISIFMLQAA